MHAPPPVVLAAEGLRKSFGARAALKGVSLEVTAGERVACIGPNGAGKTTLLTILAGIQAPDAGTVRADGRVGWVPQAPAVYDKLTAAENLRLFAELEHVDDVRASVERMLDQTGLSERAGDQVGELSGGNRQRLNVAIGLLSSPPVLLLDEPSAALDPRQRERLWEYLGRLSDDGTTVVFATHTVSEAERYAGRVLVLADGEALFWGPPHELQQRVRADGDLESAFVAFLREQGH
ncbi:MAG TPA: ABC transporter ATP-binding protein [Solirubrobacterales bacterium]|nr:ABC transporter ATP-binding protein [Solirubrobacterales bacterium]